MTMPDLTPYLAWLDARLNEARSATSDTLLLVIAAAVLVILLILRAWWKATRRARAFQRNIIALEAELAAAKWRLSMGRRSAEIKTDVGLEPRTLGEENIATGQRWFRGILALVVAVTAIGIVGWILWPR